MIREATTDDIPLIRRLAHAIWWPAYSEILSEKQISFMLENIYSEKALQTQFSAGQQFLIAEREFDAVGFAGYTISDGILKIHKLYILPTDQGNGTGRALLDHLSRLAVQQGVITLELNVNRENPALGFYEKYGFEVHREVDIPYFEFVLNDYVMRKGV